MLRGEKPILAGDSRRGAIVRAIEKLQVGGK